MITKFAAGVVALVLVAQVYAADLPRHAMQVIKEEDGRKAVFLEHGDVLQVVIPNGSGNFASDVKVDLGKSPLKLIRSVRVEYREMKVSGQLAAERSHTSSKPRRLVVENSRSLQSGCLIAVINR